MFSLITAEPPLISAAKNCEGVMHAMGTKEIQSSKKKSYKITKMYELNGIHFKIS